jgi:hypothetical protein
MPWAILKAEREQTVEVTLDDGRKFSLIFRNGWSYQPLFIFNTLMSRGLIERGDRPDPKPRFETLPGNVHGKPISPFSEYVREVAS